MLECFTSFLMVEHLYGATFEPTVGHIGSTPALSAERAALATKDGHIAVMPQGREGADKFMKLGGVEDFYNSAEFTGAPSAKEKVALYNKAMRQAALAHTTAEWMKLGEQNRIPIMRANTLDEVMNDPHLKAVDFFPVYPHPTEEGWRATKPPIHFSKTPASIRRVPPKPGQDSDDILGASGARKTLNIAGI